MRNPPWAVSSRLTVRSRRSLGAAAITAAIAPSGKGKTTRRPSCPGRLMADANLRIEPPLRLLGPGSLPFQPLPPVPCLLLPPLPFDPLPTPHAVSAHLALLALSFPAS